uniref:Uncharacterized protein n=1 Tax=Rhizophora mucronata TaxID=61149 RepID=A0A2P2R073_RHIMU
MFYDNGPQTSPQHSIIITFFNISHRDPLLTAKTIHFQGSSST